MNRAPTWVRPAANRARSGREFPAAAGRPRVGAWLRRALLSLPPDLILVSSYDFMVAPWSAARILHSGV